MSTNATQIVITAVDKTAATLAAISARLDSVTAPVGKLAAAFGGLFQASGLAAVKSAVGGLTSSLTGLAAASIGIAGVYSGTVGSIIGFANHAADAADKIGDLSERYHIATKDLQVYGSLMEESGAGSVDDAAASLGKLQKAMNEAMHGGKDQAAAFAGVGISLEALKKMRPDEVIARMADAFQGSDRDLEKNAVLLELMGKNGGAWMAVMDKGGPALRERYQQMVDDGRILSKEQIESADAFDKSWRRMQGTVEGVKNSLGLQLAERLQPLVDSIQKWVIVNRELIQSKFDKFLEKLPGIIEAGVQIFNALWDIAQKVGGAFKAVNSVLGPTISTLLLVGGLMAPVIMAAGSLALAVGKVAWIFGNLTGIIPTVIALVKTLWFVMAANPVSLVIAAIAALAFAIYMHWDSIVSYVSEAWERIKAVFDSGFFNGLIQVWLEQWQALGNGILGIIKTILPESWMPKVLQDYKLTFATDRATRITSESAARPGAQDVPSIFAADRDTRMTAESAAKADAQNIKNQISIKIDAEGRAQVTEIKSGSPQTEIDVSSGLMMAGA